MPSLDDIVAAAAGEERDAFRRAMAEDLETARRSRGGRGFLPAERPADLARTLGRDRRERRLRRLAG
ncbi:hypothetical protein [Methylobacterium indicum]|uniref:Uncharacterized protein n=1 Tax=Methylobacterium indicum TaxID=1775910 RepID=A0A8H8WSF7_9HYPH|nr:hypothetical protein [Methylobacterium indicum]BCM83618.1 hypothetical protein mvi_20790 [Methylobacterium indicum]